MDDSNNIFRESKNPFEKLQDGTEWSIYDDEGFVIELNTTEMQNSTLRLLDEQSSIYLEAWIVQSSPDTKALIQYLVDGNLLDESEIQKAQDFLVSLE